MARGSLFLAVRTLLARQGAGKILTGERETRHQRRFTAMIVK